MKIRLALLTILVGVALSACTEEEPSFLSVSPQQLTFSQGGGNQTVTVSSNIPWRAKITGSGFSVNPTSGTGDAVLTIAAEKNVSKESQKGTLKISSEGLSAQVDLSQEGASFIYTHKSTFSVPVEGGIQTVQIEFNTDYTVSVDPAAAGWIKYIGKTKASQEESLDFEVAPNDSFDERKGSVSICDIGGNATPAKINFIQAGKPAFASLSVINFAAIAKENKVKEIAFISDSPETGDGEIEKIDVPVYYSVIPGGKLTLYTSAACFKAKEFFKFYTVPIYNCDFSYLEQIDLSNVDFSECPYMFSSMFSGLMNLKTVNFGDRIIKATSMDNMFWDCEALESIDLSCFDTSETTEMRSLFNGCSSLKNVNFSGWDTHNVTTMNYMFTLCTSLENIDLSSFDTSNVTEMIGMFQRCESLKSLDLSSFNTSKLTNMGIMFNACFSLTYLDLSSFDLPLQCVTFNAMGAAARDADQCVVKLSHKTFNLLFEQTSYLKDKFIFDFTDEGDQYESSSYAKDGVVKTLQKATEGNGIDLVFMCDGFSDRMIDNGDYDRYVEFCVDALFSEEPFKSYKNFFNVYEVYAVSKNESSLYETALGVHFEGLQIKGNDNKVSSYASKAIESGHSLDNVAICVYSSQGLLEGGYSYLYYSDYSDYGVGKGISYVSTAFNNSYDNLKKLVLHECGGHSFAKLFDEYQPETASSISQATVDYYTEIMARYGHGKNIDFTSDPDKIKWSKFIADPRYASENIGAYEGGHTSYSKGVWRPTYNSVMNNIKPETTKFNAPSREAIYYRINKLAYGNDWQYDYETFVKFDLKL